MAEPFTYHRRDLARGYCDALEGTGVIDASSGLFLAAPRRIGKSTFLREDLVPEMQSRGWETLYVDLWADQTRDPADLIAEAVQLAMARYEGVVMKAAKGAGLEKVSVMGALNFELAKVGRPGGLTLSAALERLNRKSGKAIALLVDEAQHALTTAAGTNALFALKAARDQLNQGDAGKRFRLVMTGSNREKLAQLVVDKKLPFYGANVTRFPLLDVAFVKAYADWLNKRTPPKQKFSAATLESVFRLVGCLPEKLKDIVGKAFAELGGAKALDELVEHRVQEIQAIASQDYEAAYNQLSSPQKIVLDAFARMPVGRTPFSSDALAGYAAVAGQELSTSVVQGALDALKEKGILWRAGRGDYGFEDHGFREWHLARFPQSQKISLTRVPKAGRRPGKK